MNRERLIRGGMDEIDPDLRESTRKLMQTLTDEGSKREVLKVARTFTEQIERAKKGRPTSSRLVPAVRRESSP